MRSPRFGASSNMNDRGDGPNAPGLAKGNRAGRGAAYVEWGSGRGFGRSFRPSSASRGRGVPTTPPERAPQKGRARDLDVGLDVNHASRHDPHVFTAGHRQERRVYTWSAAPTRRDVPRCGPALAFGNRPAARGVIEASGTGALSASHRPRAGPRGARAAGCQCLKPAHRPARHGVFRGAGGVPARTVRRARRGPGAGHRGRLRGSEPSGSGFSDRVTGRRAISHTAGCRCGTGSARPYGCPPGPARSRARSAAPPRCSSGRGRRCTGFPAR